MSGVRRLLHSRFSARDRRGRGLGRHRRQYRRPGYLRRRVPPHLSGAGAGVPLAVRRPDERSAVEATRRRTADLAADGRRARVSRRSDAAEDSRQRRGNPAAHLLVSGVSGERAVHRRAALRTAAPGAAAADDAGRVRGERAPATDGRQAARDPDRLDLGARQGARAGIPPPQRQGQAGPRQRDGRQSPRAGDGQRRRDLGLLRGAQGRLQDSGETQDPLSPDRRGRDPAEDRRPGGRHRTRLQQQHRAGTRPPSRSGRATSC